MWKLKASGPEGMKSGIIEMSSVFHDLLVQDQLPTGQGVVLQSSGLTA